MRLPHALILLLAVTVAAFAQAPEQGADLAQAYARGMAAFQAGDYPRAASELEALINKAESTPQLEPVFFTVGSAYFNAGNHQKAIAAFKAYLAKFPQGPHAGDVAFGLAQCTLLTKNYTEAAAQFSALEKDPKLREQSLLAQATAFKEANKVNEQIGALEKLVGGELKTAGGVRGAMMLAQAYAQKGDADKAVQTLAKIHDQLRLVDNIVELNAMSVELGDQLFQKKLYADALECYRSAYPRDLITKMQTDRIMAMQQAIEANLSAARADPTQVGNLGVANNQLKADIAKAQQLLQEFQKLPDYTAAIYIRMARCFYEIDTKWEAVVVYQELLDRYPTAPERESALFGIIVSLAEVNQPQRALTRCEEYLRDFKTGANAETVGYLMGAVALQANDPRAAETYFGKMLETQPKSQYREQIRYLLANAKFSAGKHDEAVTEYKKYLQDFPKGQNVEDVNYRIALCALFSGKYEEAIKELGDYMQKYPQGAFVSDARYRLAVCKYAASLYEAVIADCKAWERDYPNNQQLAEVLALLADSYAATSRDEEATQDYIRSYQAAKTDEVMNYSLFAASKLLQKRGDWNKVSELFTRFIEEKPDHPTVLTALYWIGKAKAHEGQLDEAKRLTAETIKKYIGNPQREAVDLLISQLAQLCVKKKRTGDEAAPAPTDAPADPGAELDQLLGDSEKDQSPTAKARILYAKAELARLRKQPAEEEKDIARIAETTKPEDLSPVLLGRAGDYLVSQHKPDQARAYYQRLSDEYPKSENIDFAYNGLGEVALQKNDLPRALSYFTDGTEKIAATTKLKELTLGKGRTLLAMGRLVEARKVFEQVASVREWRGESTAFSIFSLGDIEARQGRWAEANAYFQRVYVGYQKFSNWVAKSYLRSAEAFEKLGKPQEAANTYRELVRLANEKKELAGQAETEEARRRLSAMGAQG
ncbi:MAG: tetratricopeptide repeat protein [Verrucomicrobiota bacterium]|nr:tetratricopeptide repeat protein [Verrucomicrobiota bacterium]